MVAHKVVVLTKCCSELRNVFHHYKMNASHYGSNGTITRSMIKLCIQCRS